MKLDDLLTTSQAAKELGVNESRVRQLILADVLPATKFGKAHLIKRSDLKKVAGVVVGNSGKVGRPRKGEAKK